MLNETPAEPTEKSPPVQVPTALMSQQNWLDAMAGNQIRSVFEYEMYSDAHITGEFISGLGPYSFFNTIPITDSPGIVTSPIILRYADHLGNYRVDMSKTSEHLYHRGTMEDELAALASLALGIRLMAGGQSRQFESGKDPLGRPVVLDRKPIPILRVRRGSYILPAVTGTHSLDALDILQLIPRIAHDKYVSLVRAASAYQDALWAVESEPHYAWLMFVSAIETAANSFYLSECTNSQRLHDSKPDLAKLLKDKGGEELLAAVADLIAPTLGATKKFLDFTLKFCNPEPEIRPNATWMKVEWSKLKKILSKVYDYRSRALHGGLAFPAPMYEAPFVFPDDPKPSEKPVSGLGTSSNGGTWMPADIPINLHCFHYIARQTLVNWWRSLVESKEPYTSS